MARLLLALALGVAALTLEASAGVSVAPTPPSQGDSCDEIDNDGTCDMLPACLWDWDLGEDMLALPPNCCLPCLLSVTTTITTRPRVTIPTRPSPPFWRRTLLYPRGAEPRTERTWCIAAACAERYASGPRNFGWSSLSRLLICSQN